MLDDIVVCSPDTIDSIFGTGVAHRLLISPFTATLERIFPMALTELMGQWLSDEEGLAAANQFVLALTGRPDIRHALDVLAASPAVLSATPDARLTTVGTPSKYAKNPVFNAHQSYLAATKGVNAVEAWKQGQTGSKVRAVVVDEATAVPQWVTTLGTRAVTGTNPHGTIVLHLLGARDTEGPSAGVGTAPEVQTIFEPLPPGSTVSRMAQALAELLPGAKRPPDAGLSPLQPGDVVNVSMGVQAGLDVTRDYSAYDDVNRWAPTTGHKVVRSRNPTHPNRPAVVFTTLPIECDTTVATAIRALSAAGITVVQGAGNGMWTMFVLGNGPAQWFPTHRGADIGGPWKAWSGAKPEPKQDKPTVKAFTDGLSISGLSSLDRNSPSFADAGGIVVGAGYWNIPSQSLSAWVDFNHGNRLDCFVTAPDSTNLGFGASTPYGTSWCSPVIAGVAAIMQSLCYERYTAVLKPPILRALLSDPEFGTTPSSGGKPIGSMPDLGKLLGLVKRCPKQADLLTAISQRQAILAKAASAKTGPNISPHHPYTRRDPATATWIALATAAEADIFQTR